MFANSVGVVNINGATMISQGSVLKGSPATNETGTRSLLYSSYSQRVYAQATSGLNQVTGVNRVHIFNPAKLISDMYAGYCDAGNMDASDQNVYGLSQMCFNQLKL
jgi:hypothetical protein